MALGKLNYSKNWTNPVDFPTYEGRESKVRSDMQLLYDEIRVAFNKLIDDLKASEVPFAATEEIPAATVQAAIQLVQEQIASVVTGDIPNRSLSGEKLMLAAVDTTELHDDAVTADKIADGAVTYDKVAADAVGEAALVDGSVTTDKLGSKAVTTGKLEDGAVTAAKLGNSAVMAMNIYEKAVTTEKLNDAAVETGKIADGAVTTDKLGSGAATTAKIADAAVTEAKIDTGAVTNEKLGAGAVTEAKIADGAVAYAKTSGVQQEHTATSVTIPAISAGGAITVSVNGVTASNTVLVTPAPASFLTWRNCGVRCTAQAVGSLTFAAESATGAALTANIVILN